MVTGSDLTRISDDMSIPSFQLDPWGGHQAPRGEINLKTDRVNAIVNEAFESLTTSLEAGKSGQLVVYLSYLARFHSYSWTNVMLIACQRAEATHVAGFQSWRKMNRWVKKGETGIGIIVPMIYRKKDQQPLVDEPAEAVLGFTTGYVFDVSQTEGEPVPEFATVGGDPSCYLQRLRDFALQQSIQVEFAENLGGARGLSHGGHIQLLNGMTEAETFQVLAHELAHEVLHKGARRAETNKITREAEAEAVAFVVCSAIGLDTNTASSDYIQLWNGDAAILRQSLEHIQRVSKMILEELL